LEAIIGANIIRNIIGSPHRLVPFVSYNVHFLLPDRRSSLMAQRSLFWICLVTSALRVQLGLLVAPQPIEAQTSTVLSGRYSGTGTLMCSDGTTTPFSDSGTATLTLQPALQSLIKSGGAVTGTFTASGTIAGCGIQKPNTNQGTATGAVSPGGQMMLTFTQQGGCMFTGDGTTDEITGTVPMACLGGPAASINFEVHAQTLPSAPLTVGPAALAYTFEQGSKKTTSQPILIDNGTDKPVSLSVTSSGQSWLSVAPASITVPPVSSASVSVTVDPAGLSPGTYVGTVSVAAAGGVQFPVSVNVTVSATQSTLVLSQTSLRFQAGAGAGPAPSQSVQVIGEGTGPLHWSATATTLQGDWLSVTPASGASGDSATVTVDPSKLQPGNYYGLVQFAAQDVTNSPQTVVVVFNVLSPATVVPSVQPTGLIFVGQQSGANPPSQTITVANSSDQPATVTVQVASAQTGLLLSSLTSGTVSSGKPLQDTISANLMGLAPGVYNAALEFEFSDGSLEQVSIVVIVTPSGSSASTQRAEVAPRSTSVCTPSQLELVSTELGQGFAEVAAWPVPLVLQIIDDCGSPLETGSVVASFSTGDPPLMLLSQENGKWSGTWQPADIDAATTAVITVQAQSVQPPISGALEIVGTLTANQTVPVIFPSGVVSAASFEPNAPLAPGGFASIFGKHLANSSSLASSLPLATTLAGAQVFIAGQLAPIDYASDGQLNVLVPYGVQPNSTQQLIVLQGTAYSQSQAVTIAPAQPAIYSQNQSGKGPGAIVVVTPNGTQFQADSSNPASAGDSLTIYCAGLGGVDVSVTAGAAAPASPLAKATTTISATIGGIAAPVSFAGLSPGFAGLYQVNVTVPAGVKPGPSVPVVLTGAGLSSPPVTVAIR
jgi:uncharacterized protein (TIGR03437 family)